MILLKFVGIVGLIFVTGAAALCVLTAGRRPPAILEILGLAPGLGIGLIGLGTFYLAYWQIPLTEATASIFAGGLLLGLIALNAALRPHGVSRIWQVVRPRRTQPLQPFEIVLVSLISAACLLVFAEALTQPTLGFDARAIWGMKAKVVAAYGQIYGEDFLDPDRLHAKQRYPLGLPAAVGFACQITGGFDERVGRLLYGLLFLALGFFFYGSLRRCFSRTGALVGTCLLSTLPAFTIFANGGAASGYSDVPLTYFYCVFALSLFSWFRQRLNTDLALATAFGIFALFTKNEGLALWGIAFICYSLFPTGFNSEFKRWRHWAFFAAISLAALLPWFWYQSYLPNLEEDFFRLLTPGNLAAGADRLPYLLKSFLKEFILRPHLWSLLGPGLVLAFCVAPKRALREPHGVFLWIVLFYCVFVLMIYLVIPWRMEDLVPVSLTRLLMPLSPLLVFWMLLQARVAGLLPEAWCQVEHRAEQE